MIWKIYANNWSWNSLVHFGTGEIELKIQIVYISYYFVRKKSPFFNHFYGQKESQGAEGSWGTQPACPSATLGFAAGHDEAWDAL